MRRKFFLWPAAALVATAHFAVGQSFTWTGTGGNALWSTAANWAGGATPQSGNNLNFSGTAASSTNDVQPFFGMAQMTFLNTLAGPLALSGGSLQVFSGISQQSAQTVTIGNDVQASSFTTISGTGTGDLVFGGDFTTANGFNLSRNFGTVTSFTGTLSLGGSVQISSGDMYIRGTASQLTGALNISGGRLILDGAANFTTSATLSGSILLNGGQMHVTGGSVNGVNISGGLFSMDVAAGLSNVTLGSSGTLGGNATYAANGLQWTGGYITGTMGTGANLTNVMISGTAQKTVDSRSLALSGSWSGGNIALVNGATLSLSSLSITGNNSLSGTSTLGINGTVFKFGGTDVPATTTINAPFAIGSSGTLGVAAGRLLLIGGGTATPGSAFQAINSGTMEFGGGVYTLTTGVTLGDTIGSGGTFVISSGAVNVNTTTSASGTLNQNSSLILADGGTLGGVAQGGFPINSLEVAGNSFQWAGGVITGTANTSLSVTAATFLLSGTVTKTLDTRSMNLTTSGSWSGGDIALLNGAGLSVNNLTASSDNAITGTGTSRLTLNGSLTKSFTSTGTTSLATPLTLNSGGAITAVGGTILLTGGGTAAGLFQATGTGTVVFGAGIYDSSNSAVFGDLTGSGGSGKFLISGGAVNVNTTSATVNQNTSLTLVEGGTLGGPASFYTLAGNAFQWTGGVISGSAGGFVAVSAPTTISGTATKTIDRRGVSLNNSATWSGGDIALANGGALNINNSLTVMSDNAITGTGTSRLTLSGSLTKSFTSTGTTSLATPLTLSSSAAITAVGGTILLTGGGTAAGLFQATGTGTVVFGGGVYDSSNSAVFGDLTGFSGAGKFLISGGALNVNAGGGTVNQNTSLTLAEGGTLGGAASFYTLAGSAFQWTGGAISGTGSSFVTVTAPTTISGTATKTIDRRIVNLNSTNTWSGGNIVLTNGGALGFNGLTVTSDNAITGTGTSRLTVSGSLTKGFTITGTTTLAAPLTLNSGGAITAVGGTILLTGGGTAAGLFQATGTGTVEFGGGVYDSSNSAVFGDLTGLGGIGKILISGGAVNVNLTSATVNQNTSLTLAEGGTLGGAASFYTLAGNAFQWTGGVISGTAGSNVNISTPTTISGTATKTVSGRSVNLAGTWSGGDIALINGGNLLAGALTVSSNNAITATGTSRLTVSGSLVKTSTGTTTIAAPLTLNGSGAIAAQNGKILLTGGGTAVGAFFASGTSSVEFGGGIYDLGNTFGFGSTSASLAQFLISGGAVNINASFATINQNTTLTLATGGTLGGAATFYTVGGNGFQWTGGVISGTGGNSVNLSTSAAISGTAVKTLSARNATFNSGTWNGGDIALVNGGSLTLSNFSIAGNNAVTGTSGLTIAGAVTKISAGGTSVAGTTTIAAPLAITSGGSLVAQSGKIRLTGGGTMGSGGVIQAQNTGTLEFGGGTYEVGSFSPFGSGGSGTILISTGAVNIDSNGANLLPGGSLVLASGGTLGGTATNYLVSSGTFQWTGGVITGPAASQMNVNTIIAISATDTKTLDTRSMNTSGGSWTGGNIVVNNATLNFNVGISSTGTLSTTGTGSVTSSSLFRSGTGMTTIAASFTNLSQTAVQSGTLRFTGGLVNNGSLTTQSAGTLNIATYVAGSGTVSIGAGGTLMGSGTIHGVTNIAGNLAPGNSPGQMTFESTVTFSNGGTYLIDLAALKDDTTGLAGTDWDLATLTGNAGLTFQSNSFLQVQFNGIAAPDMLVPFWNENHTWLIADLNTGTADTAGLRVANGSWGAGTFGYELQGNDLYLVYTMIPEPGTMGLAALGLAALAAGWRQKRRR